MKGCRDAVVGLARTCSHLADRDHHLPEIGGAVGRGIREFRQATKDDEPEPLDAHASVDPARVNEPARTSEPVHKDV